MNSHIRILITTKYDNVERILYQFPPELPEKEYSMKSETKNSVGASVTLQQATKFLTEKIEIGAWGTVSLDSPNGADQEAALKALQTTLQESVNTAFQSSVARWFPHWLDSAE